MCGLCVWFGVICPLCFQVVSTKGYPEECGKFFSKGVEELKGKILGHQRSYAMEIVKTEASLSFQVLEESMSDTDGAVSVLNSEIEAFKKGMGRDIKQLSS